MSSDNSEKIEFIQIKAVALAVTDAARAKRFYGETLGLKPEGEMDMAFALGEVIVLLKPVDEWYGRPTEELNARVTLMVRDSYATEAALKKRGVVISDPVKVYDKNPVGAFLDSEGNKLWFCSDAELA